MGTDQLLQFHVNKFQQLGQRRTDDVEGGADVRAGRGSHVALDTPVSDVFQHGGQAALLDLSAPFRRVRARQLHDEVEHTDDVPFRFFSVLRYQQYKARYQSTSCLVKILAVVTAPGTTSSPYNGTGNGLGIPFCGGVMFSAKKFPLPNTA